MDAEGVAEEFEPAVVVGFAEVGEDGIVDGDDDFGFGVFNIFSGVGDFGPGGRDGNAENFGVFDGGLVEGIAWVDKDIVDDYAEIVARDLALENGRVRLAKELDFEIAYFPSFATFDDDGATN